MQKKRLFNASRLLCTQDRFSGTTITMVDLQCILMFLTVES
jgi:hypothetical protein